MNNQYTKKSPFSKYANNYEKNLKKPSYNQVPINNINKWSIYTNKNKINNNEFL